MMKTRDPEKGWNEQNREKFVDRNPAKYLTIISPLFRNSEFKTIKYPCFIPRIVK